MKNEERIETELQKVWNKPVPVNSEYSILKSWEIFRLKLYSSENKNRRQYPPLDFQKIKDQKH